MRGVGRGRKIKNAMHLICTKEYVFIWFKTYFGGIIIWGHFDIVPRPFHRRYHECRLAIRKVNFLFVNIFVVDLLSTLYTVSVLQSRSAARYLNFMSARQGMKNRYIAQLRHGYFLSYSSSKTRHSFIDQAAADSNT